MIDDHYCQHHTMHKLKMEEGPAGLCLATLVHYKHLGSKIITVSNKVKVRNHELENDV